MSGYKSEIEQKQTPEGGTVLVLNFVLSSAQEYFRNLTVRPEWYLCDASTAYSSILHSKQIPPSPLCETSSGARAILRFNDM